MSRLCKKKTANLCVFTRLCISLISIINFTQFTTIVIFKFYKREIASVFSSLQKSISSGLTDTRSAEATVVGATLSGATITVVTVSSDSPSGSIPS